MLEKSSSISSVPFPDEPAGAGVVFSSRFTRVWAGVSHSVKSVVAWGWEFDGVDDSFWIALVFDGMWMQLGVWTVKWEGDNVHFWGGGGIL